MRSSPLARRTPLRRSRPHRLPAAQRPDMLAWADTGPGYCQCGCERFAMRLDGHHVIPKAMIRDAHRLDLLYDLRNRMLVHRHCHGQHTDAFRRLPVDRVPDLAREFAVDFFGGDELAADFFARYYRGARA